MNFQYPLLLLALVLPGALLVWVWANRWLPGRRRTILPFDHGRSGGGWVWWSLLAVAESVPPLLLARTCQ